MHISNVPNKLSQYFYNYIHPSEVSSLSDRFDEEALNLFNFTLQEAGEKNNNINARISRFKSSIHQEAFKFYSGLKQSLPVFSLPFIAILAMDYFGLSTQQDARDFFQGISSANINQELIKEFAGSLDNLLHASSIFGMLASVKNYSILEELKNLEDSSNRLAEIVA